MSVQTPRLIDVHHHVVLPEYEQALVRAGARDPSKPLRKNSEPQAAIDAMGQFGIAGAIINPLSVAGVHHGSDEHATYLTQSVNEALARFVSNAPKTFGFFAPLPYPDVEGSIKQMHHALDHLGADGVILLSNQNDVYVGDPRGEELWAEMDKRKVACFIHPARASFVDSLQLKMWASIIEYPFETTRVCANLIYNEYMRKYPNIRWIMAHAGGCFPYLSYRLHLMEEQDDHKPEFSKRVPEGIVPYLDKFYFDTAIAGSRAAMLALNEVALPTNIMFGSDWPYIDKHMVSQQNETLKSADLFPGQRYDQMERENAMRLFPRFA